MKQKAFLHFSEVMLYLLPGPTRNRGLQKQCVEIARLAATTCVVSETSCCEDFDLTLRKIVII